MLWTVAQLLLMMAQAFTLRTTQLAVMVVPYILNHVLNQEESVLLDTATQHLILINGKQMSLLLTIKQTFLGIQFMWTQYNLVFGQLIIKTQHFAGKDGFLQREIIVSTN